MASEKARRFGRTVAALRKRLGLSQKGLAAMAEITPSHLSRIEAGERMPSEEIIGRLAEALNTPGIFLAAGLMVPEKIKKKYKLSDFTVPPTLPSNVREPAGPVKSVCEVLHANRGLLFEETRRLGEELKKLEAAAEETGNLLKSSLQEMAPERMRQNLCDISPEKWVGSGLFWEWLTATKQSLEEKISTAEENRERWRSVMLELLEAEKTLAEIQGRITGMTEAYEMISRQAEQDRASFICLFTRLDPDMAQIVTELIHVIEEKEAAARLRQPRP